MGCDDDEANRAHALEEPDGVLELCLGAYGDDIVLGVGVLDREGAAV